MIQTFTWFSIPFAEIGPPEDRVIEVIYVLGDRIYEVIYDFDNHRILATYRRELVLSTMSASMDTPYINSSNML